MPAAFRTQPVLRGVGPAQSRSHYLGVEGPGLLPTSTDGCVVNSYTPSLSDVLRFLWKGAPMAVAAMLIAGGLAAIITRQLPPVYQSTASLVASQPLGSFGALQLVAPPPLDTRVYQSALLDGTIIPDAITAVDGTRVGQTQLEEFKGKVGVTLDTQQVSSVIHLHFRDSDPVRAALYANTLADLLVDWDRDRALQFVDDSILSIERAIEDIDEMLAESALQSDQSGVQTHQAVLATLREQRVRDLASARAMRASAVVVGSLTVMARAETPEAPIGPRLVFNTFISMVLGLVLGYGVQFLRQGMRDEVADRKRLEQATGLPVLAVFIRPGRQSGRLNGDAVSFLTAHIARRVHGNPSVVVGITSSEDHNEKSGIATTVTERLAASGYQTLLVDADLRHRGPGLGFDYEASQVRGLEHYLRNNALPVHPLRAVVNERVAFDVIPSVASTPQSSELLAAGLANFLENAKERYRVVVLDLPGLAFADVLSAAPLCDVVVMCVGADISRKQAGDAAETLKGVAGGSIGVVLTDAEGSAATSSAPPTARGKSRRSPEAVAVEQARPAGTGATQARVRVRQR